MVPKYFHLVVNGVITGYYDLFHEGQFRYYRLLNVFDDKSFMILFFWHFMVEGWALKITTSFRPNTCQSDTEHKANV
ncbi:hypothetical protein GDO81_002394 [Engystomops pustulosus]|uniref:Uncharacterized protein n=1 Tax=Engystomops pustulosus TaxID=76066 RepID=A0AAV7DJW1_ENGPU|nr:hypothetical protein GDO81_002394 [Engystomops pustulosus]